jgi:hypothetical protein
VVAAGFQLLYSSWSLDSYTVDSSYDYDDKTSEQAPAQYEAIIVDYCSGPSSRF